MRERDSQFEVGDPALSPAASLLVGTYRQGRDLPPQARARVAAACSLLTHCTCTASDFEAGEGRATVMSRGCALNRWLKSDIPLSQYVFRRRCQAFFAAVAAKPSFLVSLMLVAVAWGGMGRCRRRGTGHLYRIGYRHALGMCHAPPAYLTVAVFNNVALVATRVSTECNSHQPKFERSCGPAASVHGVNLSFQQSNLIVGFIMKQEPDTKR